MCVSIPARVTHVGRPTAASIPGRVRIGGEERDVDLVMISDPAVGEYVIVHAGYAIARIPASRARETIALLGPTWSGSDEPESGTDPSPTRVPGT